MIGAVFCIHRQKEQWDKTEEEAKNRYGIQAHVSDAEGM
jgi:hypothetical protein